ncbi:MAG TPA: glutamine--fructose-6-phosphate aminotransferase [Firmicutes bacterium]|jgi:glutamine---fructose-6-phosphate transaminase (isomerizing)|nr:glutamine--fructose-6-phosphate aminotransferase [Bacillota bacterium]
MSTQMWNEILEQPAVLESCGRVNEKVLREIVTEVSRRNIQSVIIAARGTSDHAAVYGKYVIEYELGIPVSLAAPSIFTIYKKKLKLPGTLVIGISQSGKAADVLEVLKNAGESGALTVSITNDPNSPLATGAMYHLYCNAGLEKSVAATKTFTAEIFLIAQLVAEWGQNSLFKKELGQLPQNLFKGLDTDAIKMKMERYRFIQECFVLARGINYAVALESALKIQESTYVRAKAYATSDFYHGPFAMIEKDMPVIVYAPDGPSFVDVMQMIKRLKENLVDLIVVSNVNEAIELGNCNFKIPQTSNDLLSPFYNAVIAQMLACELAVIKGLNPDQPRGLKKVTITL